MTSRIAVAEGKPMPHWTLHDLRRTMRTGLGRIGIPPHIAELVLNHTKGGIEGIYDRQNTSEDCLSTQRVGRSCWSDHVAVEAAGRFSESGPA